MDFVSSHTIETGVDKLFKMVKKRRSLPLETAIKTLEVEEEVIINWIRILEENKIIMLEYKFFQKPDIVLYNSNNGSKTKSKKERILKLFLKKRRKTTKKLKPLGLTKKTRIRSLLKNNRLSGNFHYALDKEVEKILKEAIKRAKSNERKIVRSYDL
jgi:hypothetical protein